MTKKSVATPAKRLAAAFGLCAWLSVAAYAQSVVSGLTTGATIPESEPLPSSLPAGRSQTATFGVTVGVGETDNIAETPTDRRSQTMALTGIDFGWIRTGSALDANVVGDFDYLDYLQNAYSSQLLGRFDGLTSLSLFSDRLKWFLQDDYGDGQLDPYAPVTPVNLENINVVTTGPDITLRPMSDTLVQLGARYIRTTYETSPFDGYRLSEDALLERLLSSSSNVGLGAELEELRFDNTVVNTNYDRSRYYVRYEITGSRTHITATLGETQANDGGDWYSTPLARLELTHEISNQTRLNFTAGRELTDAADTFDSLRSGAAGGIVVAPTAETSGDYLRNYVTGGLQLSGQRTTVSVTADWERDTYTVDNTFDVSRGDLELSLNRQLSSILNGGIFATLMQSRYFNQDGEINSHFIGASITWQASRTLAVEGRYSHDFQNTSGAGFGFSSNTVFVTVTYRPLQQNQPQQNQLQQNQLQQNQLQ